MQLVMQNVDTSDPDQMAILSSTMEKLEAANELTIDFSKIAGILLTVLVLYIISSLFNFVKQFVMAKVSQMIVYDMRNEVNQKLERLPLKFFDGRTHGEILSRVTNDIDTISTTLQQGLAQVITSATMLIGITVMMFTISWILTLVCLVILPLSFIFVQVIVKKSQKYFKGQQNEIGHINGHVEEMYAGHTVVKAFGKEEDSVGQFEEINERLYTVGWKAQFLSRYHYADDDLYQQPIVRICLRDRGHYGHQWKYIDRRCPSVYTVFKNVYPADYADRTDRECHAIHRCRPRNVFLRFSTRKNFPPTIKAT